jgi:hypothetical protein
LDNAPSLRYYFSTHQLFERETFGFAYSRVFETAAEHPLAFIIPAVPSVWVVALLQDKPQLSPHDGGVCLFHPKAMYSVFRYLCCAVPQP